MRAMRRPLVAFVRLSLLGAQPSAALADDPEGETVDADTFMFVGNSLTY